MNGAKKMVFLRINTHLFPASFLFLCMCYQENTYLKYCYSRVHQGTAYPNAKNDFS